MAKLYRQRPSRMLGIRDAYVAYCVDEAAAWLLCQERPPRYGDNGGTLNNGKVLAALAAMGGVEVKGDALDKLSVM